MNRFSTSKTYSTTSCSCCWSNMSNLIPYGSQQYQIRHYQLQMHLSPSTIATTPTSTTTSCVWITYLNHQHHHQHIQWVFSTYTSKLVAVTTNSSTTSSTMRLHQQHQHHHRHHHQHQRFVEQSLSSTRVDLVDLNHCQIVVP